MSESESSLRIEAIVYFVVSPVNGPDCFQDVVRERGPRPSLAHHHPRRSGVLPDRPRLKAWAKALPENVVLYPSQPAASVRVQPALRLQSPGLARIVPLEKR